MDKFISWMSMINSILIHPLFKGSHKDIVLEYPDEFKSLFYFPKPEPILFTLSTKRGGIRLTTRSKEFFTNP